MQAQGLLSEKMIFTQQDTLRGSITTEKNLVGFNLLSFGIRSGSRREIHHWKKHHYLYGLVRIPNLTSRFTSAFNHYKGHPRRQRTGGCSSGKCAFCATGKEARQSVILKVLLYTIKETLKKLLTLLGMVVFHGKKIATAIILSPLPAKVWGLVFGGPVKTTCMMRLKTWTLALRFLAI